MRALQYTLKSTHTRAHARASRAPTTIHVARQTSPTFVCANSTTHIATQTNACSLYGQTVHIIYNHEGVANLEGVAPTPTASSHPVDDGVRAETIDRDRRARA